MLEETRKALGTIDLMKASGALVEGHFELSSGLHSGTYMQCALLLEVPERAEYVGHLLAMMLREELGGVEPGVVVSPALGGIIIGHEVARALNARAVFVERVDGKMTLRRGFSIKGGEKVVVVEDVVTTGGSTKEVMEAVAAGGGQVAAVGSIVNRGGRVEFGVPFCYVIEANIPNYAREACPLCKSGMPLTKPGSRAPGRKAA